ncbi:hypothetical protein LTR62_002634 [Meristemomyces frigidus]|uniref:Opioid growth factor receptor (OGFr) conserved domain-containing protein n=1 Tax=Meristemomyces frigidus TaxID=1508187 RepID=A0AAN7T7G4_9PEZI|nr:hypothetical protein LTR62_002634 [Meristemomyces frigidus]
MASRIHPVVAFYDPTTKAPYDRHDPDTTLDRVLKYSDTKLERQHDFIQHLFPTPEPSGFNAAATTLTRSVMDDFRTRKDLRDNLQRAFVRIMDFWGFTVTLNQDSATSEDFDITPSRDFEQKARQTWLQYHNHNQLRINRMIRSLRILGLERHAGCAAAMFLGADHQMQSIVNDASLQIWLNSAIRKLQYPPPRPRYHGEMENQPVCDWLAGADPAFEPSSEDAKVLVYRNPTFDLTQDAGRSGRQSQRHGPDGEVLVSLLPRTTTYGQLYAQVSKADQ